MNMEQIMINEATVNIDGFVSLKNYVIFVPGALLKLAHSCICLTGASGLWCVTLCLQLNTELCFMPILNHPNSYTEVLVHT